MSLLKNKLRLLIPKLAAEANQLKDSEARSRWMRIRSIALSLKSVTQACSASGCSVDFFNKWGKRLVKGISDCQLQYNRSEYFEAPGIG
jgi:hypothetical protein